MEKNGGLVLYHFTVFPRFYGTKKEKMTLNHLESVRRAQCLVQLTCSWAAVSGWPPGPADDSSRSGRGRWTSPFLPRLDREVSLQKTSFSVTNPCCPPHPPLQNHRTGDSPLSTSWKHVPTQRTPSFAGSNPAALRLVCDFSTPLLPVDVQLKKAELLSLPTLFPGVCRSVKRQQTSPEERANREVSRVPCCYFNTSSGLNMSQSYFNFSGMNCKCWNTFMR